MKKHSITSVMNGREVYWDDKAEVWKYSDTNEILENWRNPD